ncbi:MAG: helix-hairpin-helix domain-containing protein [Thermodesulfobacteriota bacterium]|nr:helix-hairpin-helix domain-containing protein [Thermodesulfobacteriota bacterium]
MKECKRFLVLSLAVALVVAFVPTVSMAGETQKAGSEAHATAGEKININTASIEELTQLKGVGEKYAEAIVQFRKAHGPFKQVEDIVKVPGIGSKTFDANKDKITIH